MDVFTQLSNSAPVLSSSGSNNFKSLRTNASKIRASNSTSKNNPANEVDAVVSISQSGKNTNNKNSIKLEGSIKINNNRVNYSLTKNNDLVIKIIDKKSNEVVRQIPSEEMMRIKEALSKVLEQKLEV